MLALSSVRQWCYLVILTLGYLYVVVLTPHYTNTAESTSKPVGKSGEGGRLALTETIIIDGVLSLGRMGHWKISLMH